MARREVFTRLGALLWLLTAGWVISLILGILVIPLGILDLLITAIRGEGLSSDGMIFGWVIRSIMWNAEQAIYVIAGDGEFQWFP